MDIRLIFLYQLQSIKTHREDGEGYTSRLKVPVKAGRGTTEANPGCRYPETRDEPVCGEVVNARLPRKFSVRDCRCPYRKPTQVDEMSILRRSGEPSLRNSAI